MKSEFGRHAQQVLMTVVVVYPTDRLTTNYDESELLSYKTEVIDFDLISRWSKRMMRSTCLVSFQAKPRGVEFREGLLVLPSMSLLPLAARRCTRHLARS